MSLACAWPSGHMGVGGEHVGRGLGRVGDPLFGGDCVGGGGGACRCSGASHPPGVGGVSMQWCITPPGGGRVDAVVHHTPPGGGGQQCVMMPPLSCS